MDIESRDDIERLMRAFYAKAIPDELIGHYFTSVIDMDLEKHLPIIIDFWETVLFGVAKYKNNAIAVHQQLHGLSNFTDAHFERWLSLFTETTDSLFDGIIAQQAKQKAHSIVTVMKLKTIYLNKPF